jgi:pimeloyl-ACP methyl ester carboxylesterase
MVTPQGIAISINEYGPREGPTCIAIHGFGDGAYVWDPLARALPDWRVLSINLRGHGDSDWDEAGVYNLSAHLSDLNYLIADLGLRRFALIGHSLGGRIALNIAEKIQPRLMALATVDFGLNLSDIGQDRALSDFMASFRPFSSHHEYEEWLLATRPLTSPKLLSYISAHSLKAEAGQFINKCDPHLAAHANNTDGDYRLPFILQNLRCPVLVARGAGSAVFSSRAALVTTDHLSRGEFRSIPASGHAVVVENPEVLASELAAFLTKHQAGTQ